MLGAEIYDPCVGETAECRIMKTDQTAISNHPHPRALSHSLSVSLALYLHFYVKQAASVCFLRDC